MHQSMNSLIRETVSPELRFILECLKSKHSDKQTQDMVSLINNISDWHALYEEILESRVAPLVFSYLKTLNTTTIPTEFMESLRHITLANAARNTHLVNELIRIDHLFRSNGINCIIFKGPALALSAYDDLALRQFDDLDILVKSDDVLRVDKLLQNTDYSPHIKVPEKQKWAYLKSKRDWLYSDPEKGISIDINFSIAPYYFSLELDFDSLYNSCIETQIDGHNMMTPATEDMLHILCIHAAYHRWERLAWLGDISAFVCKNPHIDWALFLAKVEATGSLWIALTGLAVAHNILGTTLPNEVLSLTEDPTIQKLIEDIQDAILNNRPLKSSFHLKIREHITDRVRYLFRYLMEPSLGDWKFISLPRQLFYFYYLIRPFRLTGKAASMILETLASRPKR